MQCLVRNADGDRKAEMMTCDRMEWKVNGVRRRNSFEATSKQVRVRPSGQ